MSPEELQKILLDSGAFMKGHFLLTSGLHSSHYVQCARLFEDPKLAERLVGELARPYLHTQIDWVVGPALGGILLAYELARQLNAKAAFTERHDGSMQLRRGFRIPPGSQVLVCEDVVNTGGSTLEVIQCVESQGAKVVGVAALVDRLNTTLSYLLNALFRLQLTNVSPNNCPLCKEDSPLVKPGSRA